jgi:nickel superoxide dismutase
MKRTLSLSALALLAFVSSSRGASAHCEVPCGIFDDPARFAEMLEDAATISKAMAQVNDLAGKQDGQSLNQLVRWVTTKEEHAAHTMDLIGQYFMAQRIKPAQDEAGNARYVQLLTSAHAVMRQAMLCKQTTDGEAAKALVSAIEAFRKAYEAK